MPFLSCYRIMTIHKDLSKPSSIYVCVSTCYAFLELLCLFANKLCLSMVRRNNAPGYAESRQKVDFWGFSCVVICESICWFF